MKQIYEIILLKQGETIERIKTDKFSTYKEQCDRLRARGYIIINN